MQAVHAQQPEGLERFVTLKCVLTWLVLGTAVLRGRPKITALETELRALRSSITEQSRRMKPMETEVCDPPPPPLLKMASPAWPRRVFSTAALALRNLRRPCNVPPCM